MVEKERSRLKMTEKQKAANGLPYDANYDEELLADSEKARHLLYEYNRLPPSEKAEQKNLLKRLLGKTGETFIIRPPFFCDYGYNIEIGENFFANTHLVILDGGKVRIGNHVFIGPHTGIYTAGHPLDAEQRNKGLEYAFPVTIGNNVWIGGHVVINPGVSIGNNAVIGSGSVVVKDIPDNVVAVGNPCKVLRTIANENIINHDTNTNPIFFPACRYSALF